MDVLEVITSAVKTVFSNKLRTFLTMLGIVIGIGAVIAINSIGNGSTALVEEQFESIGVNKITVSLRNQGPRRIMSKDALTMDDYEYLKENLTGYSDMSPVYSSSNATITYPDSSESKNIELYGVTQDYKNIENIEILYGRFLTDSEVENSEKVIVITDTLAKSYFGRADQSVLGQEFAVRTWKGKQKFTVIGIYENPNSALIELFGQDTLNEMAILPIKTALRVFNSDQISIISINAASKELVNQVTEDATDILHNYRDTSDKYYANNILTALESANEVSKIMTLLISGVASISLFVAGIGIMNIMLVTVTERTREIGIRKSIGAKNKDILIQFIVEAVIITFIGGILGVLTGWALGIAFAKLLGVKSIISLTSVIGSLGIATIIGLVFGVYPARKASLLDPIDALTRI